MTAETEKRVKKILSDFFDETSDTNINDVIRFINELNSEFSDQQNKELIIKNSNQANTIRAFNKVYDEFFGGEYIACSENLKLQLKSLTGKTQRLETELAASYESLEYVRENVTRLQAERLDLLSKVDELEKEIYQLKNDILTHEERRVWNHDTFESLQSQLQASQQMNERLVEGIKFDNCFPIVSEKCQIEAEELAIKLGWEKNMPLENFAQIFRREQLKKAAEQLLSSFNKEGGEG